jgi:hypothetical protein
VIVRILLLARPAQIVSVLVIAAVTVNVVTMASAFVPKVFVE